MDEINLVSVQLGEDEIGLYEAPFYETFVKGDQVGVLYNEEERVVPVVDSLLHVRDTDVSNFILASFGYKPHDVLPRVMYRITYTPMVSRDKEEL